MQLFVVLVVVAGCVAEASLLESSSTELAVMNPSEIITRAKRQCGGSLGCCAGSCNCGNMGQCGQTCCAPPPCACGNPGCSPCAPPPCTCGNPGCSPCAPPPCTCGTPGCATCTTNTQLVAVQQTCCTCCRPVCTQACIQGGGCACGCTRGGCGRKRRSILAINEFELSKESKL